jgi:hypothetical protein
MIRDRRDEQAAGHAVLLTIAPGGRHRRDESHGVADDQRSSLVGTEPESPAWLVRSPVRVISVVILALGPSLARLSVCQPAGML